MFTKTKIALSAAIVLSTALSASAATKPRVSHAHRAAIYNMVPHYQPQARSDSNDPALTGGGSLGYNQNLYNYWGDGENRAGFGSPSFFPSLPWNGSTRHERELFPRAVQSIFKKTLSEMRPRAPAARNNPGVLQSPPVCGRHGHCIRRCKPAPGVRKPRKIVNPNHRRSAMKKFLTTLAVLTVVATPVFAQSFDPEVGTGNIAPAPGGGQFAYAPKAPNASVSRPLYLSAGPNAARSARPTKAARRTAIYDMVPGSNPSDPALTGGGSLGYNESLRNNYWGDEENRAAFGSPSFPFLCHPNLQPVLQLSW
jgi:hypothetical protein